MDTKMEMNLHTKLASLRKQKGLTQTDLAEKLNVSRQAISKWEGGVAVPSTENLRVLSELYGVSLDYLLNGDADDPDKSAENQAQAPGEQGTKAKSKKRWVILICAAALVMLLAAVICAVTVQGRKQEKVTPIEDMTVGEENDYPTYTFSIE